MKKGTSFASLLVLCKQLVNCRNPQMKADVCCDRTQDGFERVSLLAQFSRIENIAGGGDGLVIH
jgi:hypothetical protein